jgi:hypothetical protein
MKEVGMREEPFAASGLALRPLVRPPRMAVPRMPGEG